jgi:hypothetical protein
MAGKFQLNQNWRKSSHSGDASNCTEIGQSTLDSVFVRDSKIINSDQLIVNAANWVKFLDRIKGSQTN